MGRNEFPRAAAFLRRPETCLQFTIKVVNTHSVPHIRRIAESIHPIELANIDMVIPKYHAIWPVNIAPHRQEFTISIENLHPVCLAVHHVDSVIGVDSDIVRSHELPFVDSRATPRKLVLAFAREAMDTCVPVTIGDVDISVRRHNRRRGRSIERLPAPLGLRLLPFPNLHKFLTSGTELLNRVQGIVRYQQRVIVSDVQPMRAIRKVTLTERPQEISLLVEHHHRMLTTSQHEHIVMAIHRHTRAL